jgi:hypothetical protein
MPKYKQSAVTGESWTRAFRVEINNPVYDPNAPVNYAMPADPEIFFVEETVVETSDGKFLKQPVVHTSSLTFASELLTENNINETFVIIDENGDETSENSTYNEVYRLLSSLYIHVAKKRDDRVASTTPTLPNGV